MPSLYLGCLYTFYSLKLLQAIHPCKIVRPPGAYETRCTSTLQAVLGSCWQCVFRLLWSSGWSEVPDTAFCPRCNQTVVIDRGGRKGQLQDSSCTLCRAAERPEGYQWCWPILIKSLQKPLWVCKSVVVSGCVAPVPISLSAIHRQSGLFQPYFWPSACSLWASIPPPPTSSLIPENLEEAWLLNVKEHSPSQSSNCDSVFL